MGAIVSCCCSCCERNSDKYAENHRAVYATDSSPRAYDNKVHVSEIYGNNVDDGLVPSDNPTTSTYFGSILNPPKDKVQTPTTEDELSPANTNAKPLVSSVSLSPSRARYQKKELSRPINKLPKHSNSCSTIYVDDSTVSQPNCKAMIKCVSIAIHSHIVHRKSTKTMSIFDEKLHPLTKERVADDYDTVNPDQKTIYRFLRMLFTAAQLTAECAIVTLVYLERVLSYGELGLCPANWRRLVLGAVMLASKVWDDQAVWNVDFCQILKDITVNEMNELEREYVQLLQFNVNVASSIYAKYYFDLRQIANENQISFPDELLTKEKAIKLEALSLANTRVVESSCQISTDTHLSSSQKQALAPLLSLRRSASVELGQSSRKSLLIIS